MKMRSRSPNASCMIYAIHGNRQGKEWTGADMKDTQRIVERVWQLVRAGRTTEACDMCRQCGQPWRAASLGGGPQGGPTPLGTAAQQVTSGLDDCKPEIAECDLQNPREPLPSRYGVLGDLLLWMHAGVSSAARQSIRGPGSCGCRDRLGRQCCEGHVALDLPPSTSFPGVN